MGKNNSKPTILYSVVHEETKQPGFSPVYTSPIQVNSFKLNNGASTLLESFMVSAEKFPKNPCIGSRVLYPDGTLGKYHWKTYKEVYLFSQKISFGLSSLNLQSENLLLLGIFSKNREEWLILELACLFQNITTVPISDTICSESLVFIINQTCLSTLCCSKPQFEMVLKHKDQLPMLKTLILFDKIRDPLRKEANSQGLRVIFYEEIPDLKINSESNPPSPNGIATICYTSGTTGTPKGAVLTHLNMISTMIGAEKGGYELNSKDSYLLYLPHSHIYDRILFHIMINSGCKLGLSSGDINNIKNDLTVLKPTLFASVPRLWNRFYELINEKFNEKTGLTRTLLNNALSKKVQKYEESGELSNGFFQSFVFNSVRKSLGGNIRLMICGSAPISGEVLKFLRIVFACPIIEGYGLTEACACSFLSHTLDSSIGHIGGPLPGVFAKLKEIPELGYSSPDVQIGELLIKGPSLFQGYFKNQEKEHDEWFCTGDILQRFEHNGCFRVVDRIKNIIKLAQGEYVSLEKVENFMNESEFVSQVFAYGDPLENYLVAVVVPHLQFVSAWALENHLNMPWEELCVQTRLHYDILNDFNNIASKHSLLPFEHIRKIHLEPFDWNESDMLTPTQKLIRHKIASKYKLAIQTMYCSGDVSN